MKTLALGLFLIMVAQARVYACKNCSTLLAGEKASASVPVGCSLSAEALPERMAEIGALLSLRKEVRELENGYAFRFPGEEAELATRLATWIIAERQCCSFFEFELSFAADQGPIWFKVVGSQEAKMFIASLIESSMKEPR